MQWSIRAVNRSSWSPIYAVTNFSLIWSFTTRCNKLQGWVHFRIAHYWYKHTHAQDVNWAVRFTATINVVSALMKPWVLRVIVGGELIKRHWVVEAYLDVGINSPVSCPRSASPPSAPERRDPRWSWARACGCARKSPPESPGGCPHRHQHLQYRFTTAGHYKDMATYRDTHNIHLWHTNP